MGKNKKNNFDYFIMKIIDSNKIIEILFENSEEIPNDIYINMMNMMKRYHDFEDNEEHIREYISTIDKKYIIKFKKYLNKPCYFISYNCHFITCFCVLVSFLIGTLMGTFLFFIINNIALHIG